MQVIISLLLGPCISYNTGDSNVRIPNLSCITLYNRISSFSPRPITFPFFKKMLQQLLWMRIDIDPSFLITCGQNWFLSRFIPKKNHSISSAWQKPAMAGKWSSKKNINRFCSTPQYFILIHVYIYSRSGLLLAFPILFQFVDLFFELYDIKCKLFFLHHFSPHFTNTHFAHLPQALGIPKRWTGINVFFKSQWPWKVMVSKQSGNGCNWTGNSVHYFASSNSKAVACCGHCGANA